MEMGNDSCGCPSLQPGLRWLQECSWPHEPEMRREVDQKAKGLGTKKEDLRAGFQESEETCRGAGDSGREEQIKQPRLEP